MKTFRTLQLEHERLLDLQADEEDISGEVDTFIKETIQSSSKIIQPEERDQLRANLRFWAGYVYEKTQEYPNTDLLPASPAAKQKAAFGKGLRVVVLLIAVLGLLGVLITSVFNLASPIPTPETALTSEVVVIETAIVKTLDVLQTETAVIETLDVIATEPAVVKTQDVITSTATLQAPQMTATLPVPTEGITATPPIVSSGYSFGLDLTFPQEGTLVDVQTELEGTYENLQPGWTIHALLQPISEGGIYYPSDQFYTIPTGEADGNTWSLNVSFGVGEELTKSEEYNIKLVVAKSDKERQLLQQNVVKSISSLPEEVLVFNKTTTVLRTPYDFIEGERLVYSCFVENEGRVEIFADVLDGEKPVQLTNARGFNKNYPEVSNQENVLAYVGSQQKTNAQGIYLLNLDDLAVEEDPLMLDNPLDQIYEDPTWSSDDLFIAYSVGKVQPDGTAWSIGLYNTRTDRTSILVEGTVIQPARYPSWIPDSHVLIYTTRSRKTGTSGFHIINVDTFEIAEFYDPLQEETQGVISPDGRKLVYLIWTDVKSNPRLYVVDLETNEQTYLAGKENSVWYPAWDFNSEVIYYVSTDQQNNALIYAVNIDGNNTRRISQPDTSCTQPSVGRINYFVPVTEIHRFNQ